MDQQNRSGSPERGQHKYKQSIFDKKQNTINSEKIVFSTDATETAGHLHVKQEQDKSDPDSDLTHFVKINSKWITDLNVKCKTINLPENNIGENLDHLGHSDAFLDKTPKSQSMKEVIDTLSFIRVKNFYSGRQCQKNEKISHRLGENNLTNTHLTRGLFKLHKKKKKNS